MTRPRKPIVAGGTVRDGKVIWDNPRLVTAALKAWSGRIVITIAPEEQKRSLRALGYLFGVVYRDAVAALKEAGYTDIDKDKLHALMKARHLSDVMLDPFTGEERKVVRSTSDLTVGEMSEFMEWVMSDLAELCGISFPEPRKHEDWRAPAA
jgi:hypothetical protein